MNTNDVIQSYVNDVAMQLPRKQRNGVAFELRALIDEGVQDRAEASGRSVDAAMAIEFLRAFGRPADVAARYGIPLTIINPADGRNFLRTACIGLALLWCLALAMCLGQPLDSVGGILVALGQWWGAVLTPSLVWLGMLVFGYGTAAWARRRWPQAMQWKPRAGDRIHGGRAAMALGLAGILCGIYILLDPRWILDFFWGGRAAPMAYQALTYTDTFLQRQGPCLLVLLALNIPMYLAVIVKGRWSDLLRRIERTLGLADCAVMSWTVVGGPIFMAPSSDGLAKLIMALIIASTLIGFGIAAYHRVRPTPDR